MKKLINYFLYILDLISPKDRNTFLFLSFPDVSDNAFSMFKYLFDSYKNENKRYIWLINDIDKKDEYLNMIYECLYIEKSDLKKIIFIKKNSVLGILKYYQSKYIFYTHGLYPGLKYSKKHIIVNLWHGMPLKRIGLLLDNKNPNIPKSDFVIATSVFFQNYMAKAFGVDLNSVLVSGQPRNDLLLEKVDYLKRFNINKEKYKKIFLWTPTYRQSIIGYTGLDGELNDGLPVISENYDLLNQELKRLNAFMIIKLHPMDVLNNKKFNKFSNLLFLKNEDFEKKYCQLYNILANVDILITDFSSIYIDFLLLNRPIGFVMEDFDSYSNSRGLIIENPKEYMPGEFVSSELELFSFLNSCVNDQDDFIKQREKVRNLYHDHDKDFAKNIWTNIVEFERSL